MKIFSCPNCHKAVVVSDDGLTNKALLKCVHCGYTDYAYAFGFKKSRSVGYVSVKEIITVIHDIVYGGRMKEYDAETLVEDLYKRNRFIDHITICEIINAIKDNFDRRDVLKLPNNLMFVKVEQSSTVSIETLLQQANKYIPMKEPSPQIDKNELEVLKHKYIELQEEVHAWKNAYYELEQKLRKLTQEDE